MLPVIGNDLEDIYVTADTHFDHGNMIKFLHRPFLSETDKRALADNGGRWHDGSWKGPRQSTYKISQDGIDIMNSALIDNINKTVPRTAKLIHCGDYSINPKDPSGYNRYVERCTDFRNRINCQTVCILWGNHDIPDLIQHLFQWSGYKAKLDMEKLGTCLVLDHSFNAIWDMSHRGALHCYGHSHSEVEEYAEKLMPGRRCMDVGVDNAAKLIGEYRPFSLGEISQRLGSKPGFGFNPNIPIFHKGPTEHN